MSAAAAASGPIRAAKLQLLMPDSALDLVNRYCEAAPGVSWSNLLLDDLLKSIIYGGGLKSENVNVPTIAAVITSMYYCGSENTIKAFVGYRPTDNNDRGSYQQAFAETYAYDRKGMKMALEGVRRMSYELERRGLCANCVNRGNITIGGTKQCGSCLLGNLPHLVWTPLLIDDMLKSLERRCFRYEVPAVPGFGKLVLWLKLHRDKVKKVERARIEAEVTWYPEKIEEQPEVVHVMPEMVHLKYLPWSRMGLKQAIYEVQSQAKDVLRRGRCAECPPPAKRLRVGTTGVCGPCLYKRCFE